MSEAAWRTIDLGLAARESPQEALAKGRPEILWSSRFMFAS